MARPGATPGSAKNYRVVTDDIEAIRNELLAAGVAVGELYQMTPDGPQPDLAPTAAPTAPGRRSPTRTATFGSSRRSPPALPGRVDPGQFSFTSAEDLSVALHRAAAAHARSTRTG
ncbi:hypothetical protein ODJ79_42345 [Actinoplanes sp. KI2]|uniref:hypothetical protein n=1 Tax=Actinoplanes sp. KI2 TaxID=2983315 RepID=UPI0021D5D22D|nr:hypothetical protein [Actinoplanes sp. KI2]MCU7730399.1 hypothetical protein [Actinoplanes sp. KI2]